MSSFIIGGTGGGYYAVFQTVIFREHIGSL